MDDFEFILAVKEMKSISKICKELKIDYANLVRGKSTKENEKKVADLLKMEINKLYSCIVLDRRI